MRCESALSVGSLQIWPLNSFGWFLYNVEATCRIQGCCEADAQANRHESQMSPEARLGFGHTRWRGEGLELGERGWTEVQVQCVTGPNLGRGGVAFGTNVSEIGPAMVRGHQVMLFQLHSCSLLGMWSCLSYLSPFTSSVNSQLSTGLHRVTPCIHGNTDLVHMAQFCAHST